MPHQRSIIDQIYEAAVLPELWSAVIEEIANHTGCHGGAFFSLSEHGPLMIASKTCEQHLNVMMEEGWAAQNIRAHRVISMAPIGFVTDHDVCSEDEIANHPIYTDFLRPRGLGWSTATHVTGANDDVAVFSIDQLYDRGPISEEVRGFLNALRPHLARAAMLATQFGIERIKGVLASFEQLSIAAAAIDRHGKVRLVNDRFTSVTPKVTIGAFDRLDILDDGARILLRQALSTLDFDHAPRSIPVLGQAAPFVVHIIPVQRQARDIFTAADAIAAIVPLNFPGLPFRTIVRKLYDVTEAEARVTEALLSGLTVQAIAERQGVSTQTIRTHLKSVFAKTGVTRQADLILKFSPFNATAQE